MAGRKSYKGKPRKASQHKNDAETFERKHQILLYLDQHSMEDTIDHFYPNASVHKKGNKRRNVERWRGMRETIEACAKNSRSRRLTRARSTGCATTLSKAAEEKIVAWINNLRKDGVPVSSQMLKLKGFEIVEESGVVGFTASWSWRRGFMDRNKLSIRMRTRQGQVTNEEGEAIKKAFAERILARMQQENVKKLDNADQTAVVFEYLPKTTIDRRGVKTVWLRCGGKDKERLTAMLLGDMDGNKYPVFTVVKAKHSTVPATQQQNDKFRNGFGKRLWSEIGSIMGETDLQIYGNPTAWWNEDLSLAFLNFHFGERTENDEPVMLLWDDMSAHWTAKVTAYAASKRVILEKVPPKFTFCCQPADVAWNKPLKDRLRARWIDHLRVCMREKGKMVAPRRDQVLDWLDGAWKELSQETIANGFAKCGMLSPSTNTATTEPAVSDAPSVLADEELVQALRGCRAFDGVVAVRDTIDCRDEAIDCRDEDDGADEDDDCFVEQAMMAFAHDASMPSDDEADDSDSSDEGDGVDDGVDNCVYV
ncbi:hypothetical protein P43SY_010683 [Pythium insidiosum]|uniref:HTH CENPB-type domain-containing protein n=1 Tax=Pythium insidiosum TaxID=114742 RepID=A0AAD5Q3K3_PYTIN|nr:hypothetical protein P43SY_010683 [Pythium insidiosum]